MEYSLMELISMLDEVVRKAQPVPLSKKSMVDVSQIDEIATEMRLVLPKEVQQAQNVVADKNRIINDAKREAEEIINRAETQRKHILDETDVMKQAHQRAMDTMRDAQAKADDTVSQGNIYIANRISNLEDTLIRSINEVQALKKRLEADDKRVAAAMQQRAAQKAQAQKAAAQQRAAAQQGQAQAQQGQPASK